MKAILQSIKPQYCELIAAGKKTIEVRKTKPNIPTPFKVYIYMTKSNLVGDKKAYKDRMAGKVIGEYVCDEIYQYTTCDFKDGTDIDDETMTRLSCLSKSEIKSYELSPGQFGVFGWHISNLKIYEKPKELGEFKKINRDCWYADLGLAKRDCPECDNKACFIQRPPQSWCYVEEK